MGIASIIAFRILGSASTTPCRIFGMASLKSLISEGSTTVSRSVISPGSISIIIRRTSVAPFTSAVSRAGSASTTDCTISGTFSTMAETTCGMAIMTASRRIGSWSARAFKITPAFSPSAVAKFTALSISVVTNCCANPGMPPASDASASDSALWASASPACALATSSGSPPSVAAVSRSCAAAMSSCADACASSASVSKSMAP